MKHYIRITAGPYTGTIYEFATKKEATAWARAMEKLRPYSTDYGNERDAFPEVHLTGDRRASAPPRSLHGHARIAEGGQKFKVGDIVRRTAAAMRSMGIVSGPINGRVEGYSGRWPLIRWSNMSDTDEPMAQAEEGLELDKRAMAKRGHARIIHQEPTGRPVFAEHERDHHITTAGRRALTASQFALPPGAEEKRRGIKGRLPIDTLKRARNALARAAQMAKRGEITARQLTAIQHRVNRAFPEIHVSPIED